MKTAYAPSAQQWAAISAPLAPAVVIAGRRLRQDHADGGPGRLPRRHRPGPPRRGARPDLHHQGRQRAARRGSARRCATAGALDEPVEDGEDVLEPTVATYNAYAAGLLTDHGLRIGHEPDTRVITDAARYQLGARVVDRFTGEVRLLTDHPETAIQNLLALDSAMSEHLVQPADVRRARRRGARAGSSAALADEVAGKNRKTYREPVEKAISAIDRRSELLGAGRRPTGGSSATSG